MSIRRSFLYLTPIVASCLSATTQHITSVAELRDDSRQAYKAHNVTALSSELSTVIAEWPGEDVEFSSALSVEICDTLSRDDYSGVARFDIVHQASIKVLGHEDCSFDVRARLAASLSGLTRHKAVMTATKAGPAEVIEDATALVDIWNILTITLDKSWDADNAPPRYPPGPVGIWPDPGAPPDSIEDPSLRRKYEENIRLWKTQRQQYAVQSDLHDAMKWFPGSAEKQLVMLARLRPASAQELSRQVNRLALSQSKRDLIVHEILDGANDSERDAELKAKSAVRRPATRSGS